MKPTFAILLMLTLVFLGGSLTAQNSFAETALPGEAQASELSSGQLDPHKHNLLRKFRAKISKKIIRLKGKAKRTTSPPSWRKEIRALAIVALVLAGLVILGAGLFAAVEFFAIPSAAALMGLALLLAMLGAIFTAIIALKVLFEHR